VFVSFEGMARRHSGAAANADTWSAHVETGLGWSSAPGSRRGVALLLGGYAGLWRSTFTDPVTGNVYALQTSPSLPPVPIPRRLDADEAGAFAKLDWRIHRTLRLSLEGRIGSTDYVEDYPEVPDVEPLDHDSWTVRPGVLVRAVDGVWIELAYVRSEREYDGFLARDPQGSPVPGETRRFDYSGFEVRARFRPGARWRLELGHLGTDRSDPYAGYFDSRGSTTFVAVARQIGLLSRLELYASQTDLDYERATVESDPAAGVLTQDARRISARFERILRSRIRWFATATRVESDNRDLRFVYDRTWLQTGIRLEM